jgi:SSS family solute:Na+ symporter
MATLDWIVLGVFFLGLIGIIVWVLRQKEKDTTIISLPERCRLVVDRVIHIRINIGIGAPGRTGRSGFYQWNGHGPLGNAAWWIIILGWVYSSVLRQDQYLYDA